MIPTPRSTWTRLPGSAWLRILPAALPLLVLSACADSTGPVDVQGPQDQIFFFSTSAGNQNEHGSPVGDIYRMSADGSNVERLTAQSSAYRFLRPSPDGTRLAFYASIGQCYDIWVMDLDGSALTQLTGVAAYERCNEMPHWSPDGSKIAFDSSRHPELGWDAYVINADGTGVVNVSNNPSTDQATYNESVDGWSPDGRVVLDSFRDGTERTYLVNADGTGLEPLFASGDYLRPEWSPDGTKVLASSDRDGNRDLYVMNADGTGAVNLTHDPAWDGPSRWAPGSWSPDGTKIAFYSMRTGDQEVFVVDADGTGLVNVSDDPAQDVFLDWSPDGARVLFASDRSGDQELYVVNVDGTGLTPLAYLSNVDGPPQAIWLPPR